MRARRALAPHRFRLALALVLCLASLAPLAAQFASGPYVRPFVELLVPVFGDEANYSEGFAAGSMLEYPVFSFLIPFARGAYDIAPLKTTSSGSLNLMEGDLGVGFALRAGDNFGFRLDAMGGAANATYQEEKGNAYVAGLRLGASLRISPSWTVSATAGLSRYYGSEAPFLTMASAGLIASLDLSTIGGRASKLRMVPEHLDAVFPSLYAYYDDHPFGTAKLTNGEDATIKNVTVLFNAGHYMDQPKVCAQYASIPAGGSVSVPITALFTDQVLSITQGVDAKGEIIVRYSYIGAQTEVRFPLDFRMHYRNAITWVDDRRAAAFVSPTNAASLWFSKYASGIVRDRLRGDIDKNLQYAIGLFEAERLYGLNYVVVPANDYSVKHADTSIIDSVQFPHQTLQNRGGDCSDLAILYTSLLQSLGISAAFITIPGHIFAAFDLGISEEQAHAAFYDQGLLIYRGGHVYAPVEITMVKDGFMKAWKVGAKEWYDNSRRGQAAFYVLGDCWKVYPPAAFPDVNPRFTLPDEADTMQAFDTSLDRFVVREIDPQVQELNIRLAGDPNKLANELGILYGRYGMLKEAWTQFSAASKGGYASAWDNLANVAYLRKDFKLALSYYQYARKLGPDDDIALLGIARCQYELEHYDESDAAYAQLEASDPKVAARYTYLASIFGGTGRAWSLSDRFATTEWARPREAPPVVVAEAPPPAAPKPSPTVPPPTVAAPPAAAPAAPAEVAAAPEIAKEPPSAPDEKPVEAPPPVVAPQVPKKAPVVVESAAPAPPVVAALPEDADVAAKVAAAQAAKAATPKAVVVTPSIPAPLARPTPAPVAPPPPTPAVAAQTTAETPAETPPPAAEVAAPPPVVEAAPVAETPVAPAPAAPEPTAPAVALAPPPVVEATPAPVAMPPVAPAPVPVQPAPAPPPAAAPSAPAAILEGFGGSYAGQGTWRITASEAEQTDPEQFYSKLITPLVQESGPYRYVFTARSEGKGWVGFGAHIYTHAPRTHKGWGEGESLLVWLTYDPVHYPSDVTRLQLYRSYTDSNMTMEQDFPIAIDISKPHTYQIDIDPHSGNLTISIDGAQRMRTRAPADLGKGEFVVFRTIDKALFSDFHVEATK